MDFKSTTSRLRRTFAYPTDSPSFSSSYNPDSSSDSDAPPLDEQEQEDLIRALSRQNASRNAQFRLFLLSVPLLSSVPYLLVLVPSSSSSSPSSTNLWVAALALSSLASTAWTLWALPPGVTGVRALDAWIAGNSSGSREESGSSSPSTILRRRSMTTATMGVGPMAALAQWTTSRRKKSAATTTSPPPPPPPFFWAPGQRRSPLEQYLPFLNAALCAVLVLTGLLSGQQHEQQQQQHWGHVGLNNLPAVVYVVVLAAKMVMGSVDPERELAGLKYGYKGA
ncbi:hypothetical protein F5X96DRAFT_563859 [Biscogniauxia mediterranea]|nr:hypothetical protein F5X96DRAFT_563859 [Biscogniauxia mediterranea]